MKTKKIILYLSFFLILSSMSYCANHSPFNPHSTWSPEYQPEAPETIAWLQAHRVQAEQPTPNQVTIEEPQPNWVPTQQLIPAQVVIERNRTYIVTGDALEDLANERWDAQQQTLAAEQRAFRAEHDLARERDNTEFLRRANEQHQETIRNQGAHMYQLQHTVAALRERISQSEAEVVRLQTHVIPNLRNTITFLWNRQTENERASRSSQQQ